MPTNHKQYSKGTIMYDETVGKWVALEPVAPDIEASEDNIRIRLCDAARFGKFTIAWIDQQQGIKAIRGFEDGVRAETQALLFEKEKWSFKDAYVYKKEHFPASIFVDVDTIAKEICDEMSLVDVVKEIPMAKAHIIELVTAATIDSFDNLVKAGLAPRMEEITQNMAQAGIPSKDKDLMFVSFKLAHAGVNANKDEFLAEELLIAEKTPEHKLVNWQHNEPNIGCVVKSKNIKATDSEPAHIHVVSAISKMKYPAFAEELLERFEEKRLFASMETWFEKARCSVCGNEYASPHDYCDHLNARYETASCSRQLVGLTFAGAAVAVDAPADHGATITDINNNE